MAHHVGIRNDGVDQSGYGDRPRGHRGGDGQSPHPPRRGSQLRKTPLQIQLSAQDSGSQRSSHESSRGCQSSEAIRMAERHGAASGAGSPATRYASTLQVPASRRRSRPLGLNWWRFGPKYVTCRPISAIVQLTSPAAPNYSTENGKETEVWFVAARSPPPLAPISTTKTPAGGPGDRRIRGLPPPPSPSP
jgi:hypothetical protein